MENDRRLGQAYEANSCAKIALAANDNGQDIMRRFAA